MKSTLKTTCNTKSTNNTIQRFANCFHKIAKTMKKYLNNY